MEREGKGRVEAIFAPTTKTMYPTLPPDSTLPGVGSFVTITPLASVLEGKSRPVERIRFTACLGECPAAWYSGSAGAEMVVVVPTGLGLESGAWRERRSESALRS